jgi:peptidoglycan hydrolase-like protein with peptidoglycan-binding domain
MARRPLSLLVAFGLVIAGSAVSASASAALTPPTPHRLPANIAALADYVPQDSCDPRVKPGSAAVGRLLVSTYHGTSFASAYACATDGKVSEHYEGRAVDWMASVRNGTQAAQAHSFLSWLFKTDAAGHRFANARRLGVMYIVFDNRIWGGWDGAWHPHSSCASHPEASWDSTCHRNHMHISLSWEGAMKRTSFWSGRVAAPDYGPCRTRDLNWAVPYTKANPRWCAEYRVVSAPAGSSATMRDLVAYSGAVARYGSTGPAVAAVQRAVHVSTTGNFLARTQSAVRSWQNGRHLAQTGVVDAGTWRALLRAYRPAARRAPKTTPTHYPNVHLAYGSTGPGVVAVQRRLNVQPVSGWFGPLTRGAVTRFQQSRRLTANGVVDGRTWVALGLH